MKLLTLPAVLAFVRLLRSRRQANQLRCPSTRFPASAGAHVDFDLVTGFAARRHTDKNTGVDVRGFAHHDI
jgi:hypothetical protein